MKVGGLKEKYQIGKKLGEGGFGEVRFCRERSTKEPRAVKFLRKNMLTEEDKNQIFHEVKILSEMDHPNIVKLFEFYEEPKNYCLV